MPASKRIQISCDEPVPDTPIRKRRKPAVRPVKAWCLLNRGQIDIDQFFYRTKEGALWIQTERKAIPVLITPLKEAPRGRKRK